MISRLARCARCKLGIAGFDLGKRVSITLRKRLRVLRKYIARNLCLNHIKLQKQVVSIDSLDDFRLPSVNQPGSTSVEELVNTSLNALKFEDRELLVLHMYCGYRFDEIAEMLNISPNAVWTRASRARAQLREFISRYQRNDKNI
mgnify:CR=1 FL=1